MLEDKTSESPFDSTENGSVVFKNNLPSFSPKKLFLTKLGKEVASIWPQVRRYKMWMFTDDREYFNDQITELYVNITNNFSIVCRNSLLFFYSRMNQLFIKKLPQFPWAPISHIECCRSPSTSTKFSLNYLVHPPGQYGGPYRPRRLPDCQINWLILKLRVAGVPITLGCNFGLWPFTKLPAWIRSITQRFKSILIFKLLKLRTQQFINFLLFRFI